MMALVGLALAGCTLPGRPLPDPDAPSDAPRPEERIPERSEASLELSRYYARVQRDLLSQGLLRGDGGGPDTPFDERVLAENFIQIALFDEYVSTSGRLVARPTPSTLRRWSGPISLSVEFGQTVDLEQRRNDLRNIDRFAGRLARLTGVPIRIGARGANFHVLVLNEDERLDYGPRLRELVPGISDPTVNAIVNMPRSTFCLVFAFAGADRRGGYTDAIVVIRGEHPDLLRQSCIHEELAQAMGLANDSPTARPTIFNDDEEFGLLTTHDEFLLQMLYDPRLTIGMNAEEAGPIVRQIAAELLSPDS